MNTPQSCRIFTPSVLSEYSSTLHRTEFKTIDSILVTMSCSGTAETTVVLVLRKYKSAVFLQMMYC